VNCQHFGRRFFGQQRSRQPRPVDTQEQTISRFDDWPFEIHGVTPYLRHALLKAIGGSPAIDTGHAYIRRFNGVAPKTLSAATHFQHNEPRGQSSRKPAPRKPKHTHRQDKYGYDR
jgi:hypothetical protein